MTVKTTLIAAAALVAAGIATAPQARAGGIDLNVTLSPGGIVLAGHRDNDRGGWHRGGRHDRGGWHRGRHASPGEITRKLRRHGFVSVFDYDRHGPFYSATAKHRNGHLYRLRVSAFDGDILSRQVIGGGRGWRR